MSDDALIIIDPIEILKAPRDKLRLQWNLAGNWEGPVFITGWVDDLPRQASPAANTYIANLEVVIDEKECVGGVCRCEGDENDSLEEFLSQVDRDGHVTITGSAVGATMDRIATRVRSYGFEVTIDPSAAAKEDLPKRR